MLYIEGMPRAAGPLQPMTPLAGVVGTKIYEQRITTIELATNRLTQVSPADVYVYEYDWLPDSSGWVATAAYGSGDNNWWIARLYALTAPVGLCGRSTSPSGRSRSLMSHRMASPLRLLKVS